MQRYPWATEAQFLTPTGSYSAPKPLAPPQEFYSTLDHGTRILDPIDQTQERTGIVGWRPMHSTNKLCISFLIFKLVPPSEVWVDTLSTDRYLSHIGLDGSTRVPVNHHDTNYRRSVGVAKQKTRRRFIITVYTL